MLKVIATWEDHVRTIRNHTPKSHARTLGESQLALHPPICLVFQWPHWPLEREGEQARPRVMGLPTWPDCRTYLGPLLNIMLPCSPFDEPGET
jgi:hypothetical protein